MSTLRCYFPVVARTTSRRSAPIHTKRRKPATRSFLQDLQLDRLPEDIVGHAFSMFSIRELSAFLRISTEWRKWVSAALLVKKGAEDAVPISRIRSQHAGECASKYMNFLGLHCTRLRYVDLTANCVTIGPLLALLSRSRRLEYFGTGDILTDVSTILPRAADYEVRYESSRLAAYSSNLKVVLDHLAKHCPRVRMLCFQTVVDSDTVAKLVELLPNLEGVQLGGLSLTSTYGVADVVSLLSHCRSLRVANFLCSKTGRLHHVLDSLRADIDHLEYLAVPYCDVNDRDCRSLAEWGTQLLELNLGCDLLSIDGLKTLVRYCTRLQSLCLTMGSRQDYLAMLTLLACQDSFPNLRLLGIRSPRGSNALQLRYLHVVRPRLKIYEYRDKPRIEDEWCFPRFNFPTVCGVAGLLGNMRPSPTPLYYE